MELAVTLRWATHPMILSFSGLPNFVLRSQNVLIWDQSLVVLSLISSWVCTVLLCRVRHASPCGASLVTGKRHRHHLSEVKSWWPHFLFAWGEE